MSDLLPPNATPQEHAMGETVARVSVVPTPARDMWNPDTCPEELLPWLAWAFSLDDWDNAWTEAQKRAAVKASYSVHRHKGTIGSVKDALAALFYDAKVQEWFNQIPEGDPYTFNVLLTVDQVGIPQQSIQNILTVIERTKNLRSHMGKVQVIAKTQAGPTVAAVTGLGSNIRVTNYVWATTVFNETTICM